MPPESSLFLAVLLVPQRQLAKHALDVGVIGGLAEEPAREANGVPNLLEGLEADLLRHEAHERARRAPVALDVVARDRRAAAGDAGDAADGRDERGLARPVGAEKRKDLPLLEVERDALQGLETRVVGLAEIADGQDRCHETSGLAAPW
jgi:hypothetical protein